MEERPVNHQALEPLPQVIVSYDPDHCLLSIHNGLGTSDGEEIGHGLTVFYDAEGHPAGIVLDAADLHLRPFLDTVRSKEKQEYPVASGTPAIKTR